MIDIHELSDLVRENIASNLGLEDDMEALEARLKNMTPYDALNCFLIWNGIIGWTDTILVAMNSIADAAGKPHHAF